MDYFIFIVLASILFVAILLLLAAMATTSKMHESRPAADYAKLFKIGAVFSPIGAIMIILTALLYGWNSTIYGIPLFATSISYLFIGWFSKNGQNQ